MSEKNLFNMEVKAITEEGDVIFEGLANAAIVDDVGDLMTYDKVDMRRYEKNPILLYNHNRDLPIGRTLEKTLSEKGLWIKGKISKSKDPFVSYVRDLVKEGILKTLSIGFEVKNEERDREGVNIVKEWRLNEISVVTLPANIDSEFALAAKSLADKNGISYHDFLSGKLVTKGCEEDENKPKADPEEPKKPEGEEPKKPEGEEPKASESVQECIARKIPKLIEEGRPREQAIAIAVSMCSAEGKCGVEALTVEQWASALGEKQVPPPPPATTPAQPIPQTVPDLQTSYGPAVDLAKAQVAMLGEIVNLLKTISAQLTQLAKIEVSGENENESAPSTPLMAPDTAASLERAAKYSEAIKEMVKRLGLN